MRLFNHLTIKLRLTLLVGVATVIMLAIGLLGLNGIRTTAAKAKSIYGKQLVPTGQLGRISELMEDNEAQLDFALQQNPNASSVATTASGTSFQKYIGRMEKNVAEIGKLWSGISAKLPDKDKGLADAFAKARDTYIDAGLRPVEKQLRGGRLNDTNRVLLEKFKSDSRAVKHAANDLIHAELDNGRAAYRSAMSEANDLQVTFITLLLIGIGLSVLQAIVTIRGINRGVHQLGVVVTELAEGNLTCRSGYARKDELGHIAEAVDRMAGSFQQIVRDLSSATSQLAAAAEETSAVTEQTSTGIRQQQSETEQVATAMNEMNATVHDVAHNASEAAAAANRADEEAGNGRKVVAQTIEAMDALAHEVEKAASVIHSLDEQSENIGGVLDVIRGVAEQTNLLALNAAIEAARAGEQGRGFAVVADEVRTLASRTQQSTQEIQEMIETLQAGARNAVQVMASGRTQAQAGVDQAAHAGTSLESITRAVGTISDMNTQIASAAEEQSAVAEEINRNIATISQVADQTSEGAQQTATAAEELAKLATQLQSLVSRFHV